MKKMTGAKIGAILVDILLFFAVSAETASGFVARQRYPRGGRQGQRSITCYLSEQGENHRVAKSRGVIENRDSTDGQCWESEAIRWIDDTLDHKSKQSPFAIEESDKNNFAVPFEWVVSGPSNHSNSDPTDATPSRNVALRTTGNVPLLDAESIASIRDAAQNLWDDHQNNNKTSRFTLQFEDTNLECHLEDLVASDATGILKEIVDNLLTTKVYPLARSAFGGGCDDACDGNGDGQQQLTNGSLCVYDSLVVRYNGEKATNRFGASQPLHRDGGVVSVNIALNSHDVGENSQQGETRHQDRFVGGGTFFEDLICEATGKDSIDDIDDDNCCRPILRPVATGHAVAHWSTKRHAGAPTTSGTRDILVFFLTQRKADETNDNISPLKAPFSGIERSFHLKLKGQELTCEMALRCLNLAIDQTPFDGQAHSLKGVHLIRGTNGRETSATEEKEEQRWQELNQSIYHLIRATKYAPFDARISCYLGTAYRQRWMFAQRTHRMEFLASSSSPSSSFKSSDPKDDQQQQQQREELCKAMEFLQRALFLHERYREFGISSDFDDNATIAMLTLGEVLMQLERYDDAIRCLSKVENNSHAPKKDIGNAMRQHINSLIAHCKEKVRDEEKAGLLAS